MSERVKPEAVGWVAILGSGPSSLRNSIRLREGVFMYIGSVLGGGILVTPAIAASIAEPASLVAWVLLSLLSYPISYTFGALANAPIDQLFLLSGAGFTALYILGSASAVKLLQLQGLKRSFQYVSLITSIVVFFFVREYALRPLAIASISILWTRWKPRK
jgi:hypothetical protein